VLELEVAKRFDEFELDAALSVPAGSTLVVVGESGAGKTTLLRLLAGLDHPDQGRIALGGDVYFDGARRVAVPPWQREVGFVPQDYALFPHLTVFENVAFGLRAQGTARAIAQRQVKQALEQVGIEGFAHRHPGELSGGQQQRAALARALVLEPKLLLLDEPLSALDLRNRQEMRAELRRTLTGLRCVTLYVTHTPTEALTLGDQLAVMEHGRLTQVGDRQDLLRRPRSPYVAAFLGVNLFHGRVLERIAGGLARVGTAAGDLWVVDPGGDGDVFVTVNPREITLYRDRPSGSAQNTFYGSVRELIPEPPNGERVRVTLHTRPPLVAEVTSQAVVALTLREGEPVWAAFKATGVGCYQ
jgi:molybdate transport system ATP-binding protein